MKLYTYILLTSIFCIIIICIIYYIKNNLKKKESYTNPSLKILQIGLSDIKKTISLSKKTNINDYLLVTTKNDNIDEHKKHNIKTIIFNSQSSQLHDLFYYNLSKFNILYIDSDYISTNLTNFIINDLLQTDSLEFKIIILQFDNKRLQHKLNKYYTKYENNIYILKKFKITKELHKIINIFNN